MSARTKHWAVARLMVGVALTLAFVSTAFGAPSLAPQKPTITAISPQRGPVGTTVTITGSNLMDVNSVAFGAVVSHSVQVIGEDGTSLQATVPQTAGTGPISVTTGEGTAVGGVFTVTAVPARVAPMAVKPVVSSFAPKKGKVGTMVTVAGRNFATVTSVAFGGAKAMFFKVISSGKLSVRVPAKARTGRIRVTTPLGFGFSSSRFDVLRASV
jgi:hypothetical protein